MKKANSRYVTGCLAVGQLEKKSGYSTVSHLEIFAEIKVTFLCLVKQNLPSDPPNNGLDILILFLL